MRDPGVRLGGSKRDALDIINHPYFEGFEWEKLISREMIPEYIPIEKSRQSSILKDSIAETLKLEMKMSQKEVTLDK